MFDFLSTQWRVSDGMALGLDYNTVPLAIRALGIEESHFPEVLNGVREMETQALVIQKEQLDKQKKK